MNKSEALAHILNSARAESSPRLQELVPELRSENGTISNFNDLSNVMLNETLTQEFNSFFENLVNKIVLLVVDYANSVNPLAVFKKSNLNFGDVVQRVFTNPAKAEDLGAPSETGNAKLFAVYAPDTKAVYIRVNRGKDGQGDVYTVTTVRRLGRQAFTSEAELTQYFDSVVSSLTEGNTYDEYRYIKQLIALAIKNNQVVISPVSTSLTTSDDIKQFVVDIRTLVTKFRFRSTSNNAYTNFEGSMGDPALMSCPPERIVLVIEAELEAKLDVEVLALAFNLDRSTLMGRIVVVDTLQDVYPGARAVLCDENWIEYRDAWVEADNFHNPASGVDNYYLRVGGLFGIVGYCNAVAFVDQANLPSIASTAITTNALTVAVGGTLNYRLTPANSTQVVNAFESDGTTAAPSVVIDQVAKTAKFPVAGTYVLKTADGHATGTITVS